MTITFEGIDPMTESAFKQLIARVESWFVNPASNISWDEQAGVTGLLLDDDEASTLHELLFYMEHEMSERKS